MNLELHLFEGILIQYCNKNNSAQLMAKIVSEYDQEIPQYKRQTTLWQREEDPLNHHETPGRQIKQNNQLSLPHQDDCNTRIDIK